MDLEFTQKIEDVSVYYPDSRPLYQEVTGVFNIKWYMEIEMRAYGVKSMYPVITNIEGSLLFIDEEEQEKEVDCSYEDGQVVFTAPGLDENKLKVIENKDLGFFTIQSVELNLINYKEFEINFG